MLNREKYGNKVIGLAVNEEMFGLKNGEPVLCWKTNCIDCDFYEKSTGSCKGSTYCFREWLNSEHVEPPVDWSKVAVDTPILVRDSEGEKWKNRHFAKYEGGIVYAWRSGATSWSACSNSITDWGMAKLAESEE